MSLAYPPLAWLLLRCVWIARTRHAVARRAGLARLAARGGDGVRRRLPRRSQRARVERDRRRLLGDHRRRPDRARPEPVRALPGRGSAAEVRPCRQRRRGARPRSRRTAGARPRTRSATPTGRSPTSRTSRATRSSAGATSGTGCRAVHLTSILFDTICLIGLALVGRRFGGPPTRGGARVRVGDVAVLPVRLELEHERLDRARAARLGLPRPDEPGRARRGGRALRLDEVRLAPAAAALVRLSGGAPPAQRSRLRSLGFALDDAARLLRRLPRAVAAACCPCLLRPDGQLPDRPRLTVLALGLAAVPREGHPRPAPRAARAAGAARRRLARARAGSRAAARPFGSRR